MAAIATKSARKNQKSTSKSASKKAAKSAASAKVAPKSDAKSATNPYRVGGGYWASVEALRTLGIGKLHSFDSIVPAVKKAMAANWKEFAAKKGKLSADERALVNVMVTSRADYGKPLREVGYEVRWNGREKVAGLFKMNGKK